MIIRMPRRSDELHEGEFYHVYNRGANGAEIFFDRENYLFFLRRFRERAPAGHVTVLAYCLMPNHYHFLLRQDDDTSAGLLPQLVFSGYAKAFNKRYDRTGTLFEGRYQSIWVDDDGYLLHLCRYIHANPVKAGMVLRLEDWPFSNYLEWMDLREGVLIDRDFVAEWFPHRRYRQFFLYTSLRSGR